MSLVKSSQSETIADGAEPTLGALLTKYARTGVAARLYQMLQLGIPVAVDWGVHGHWRAAAAGLALAALGGWGLADRWLYEAEPGRSRTRLVRCARAMAGTLAALIPALLVMELFLHLLGSAPIS